MKLFVVLIAVVGYASADCGCLRNTGRAYQENCVPYNYIPQKPYCSKNLEVAGEVLTERQCGPVKVIYRTDGAPAEGSFYAFSALPIVVQKPQIEAIVAPPLPTIPIDYNYKCTPFVRNHNNRPDPEIYGGVMYPVKVQAPQLLPPSDAPGAFSLPLVGLKACVDRVVVPASPNYRPKYNNNARETSCKTTCTTRQVSNSCSCRYNITINITSTTKNITKRISKYLISPAIDQKNDCHRRSKRQLPIIDHGIKFMMNMLPKFIQDPLKHTVNTIALTHPDKRIQQIQQTAPKLAREKKKLEERNKVLERRLDLYKKISPSKTRIINNRLNRKEVPNFIDSLMKPAVQKKQPKILTRFEDSEEELEDVNHNSWLKEYKARDIIGNDLDGGSCCEEEVNSRKRMTHRERLMHRLRKINQRRLRRSINQEPRSKRSTIVIDSDELSPPIYKVKVRENLVSSESEEQYGDYDSYEEKSYRKPSRKDTMKEVIRNELKKLKEKKESADSSFQYNQMVPKSPIVHLLSLPGKFLGGFDKDNVPSILSFPRMIVGAKRYFRDFGKNFRRNFLNFASDVIGDFEPPTEANGLFRQKRSLKRDLKQYEREYNLAFDEVEEKQYKPQYEVAFEEKDTEQYEPEYDIALSLKKDLKQYEPEYNLAFDEAEEEQYKPQYEVAFDEKDTEQYQPEYDNAFDENDNDHVNDNLVQNFHNAFENEQNFRNVTGSKIRKRRYVLSMVNEDDVEKYLIKKLEKIFAESDEEEKPKRRRYRKYHSSSEEEIVSQCQHCRKRQKKKDNSIKKIVVEKVRPKVIIDNKGLPFMEIDGYKRPLFLKKDFKHTGEETVRLKKSKKETVKMKLESSSEDEVKYVHYDSSEEVTCDKIHHILSYAHGAKSDTEVPLQTIRERASQILYETDILIHMDFGKYAEIFDQLIELQYVKRSIVQDWKRLIMSKKCNDKESKLALLEKFKDLQHLKDSLLHLIVCTMNEDIENTFIIRKFTRILVILQKLQCIMNQVVGCFENKFARDLNFEIEKDIKFVDILDSLKFAPVKTRHEIITKMEEERNLELEAKMTLMDKLKKVLINDCDDSVIIEQANLVWEIRNLEKMQVACIEEMHEKLQEGCKIKKNLKILFDLSKRLQACHDKQCSFFESEEEVIEEEEDGEEEVVEEEEVANTKVTVKKLSLDEIKQKIEEKVKQHKELLEKRLEKFRKAKSKNSDEKT